MPHGHLGRLHEAHNVGPSQPRHPVLRSGRDYCGQSSTDDDQVNSTEFLLDFITDRRRIVVRDIDATHQGGRPEGLAQGFKSIEPAGQQSQTPSFAVQTCRGR